MGSDLSNEGYNNLIKNIELKNIFLHSVEIENKIHNTESLGEALSIKFFEKNCFSDSSDDNLIVYVEYNLIIENTEDTENTDLLVNMLFVHKAEYILKDLSNYSINDVDRFVCKNAVINIWPYAREFVSIMTTQLGLPPVFLYTRKFF